MSFRRKMLIAFLVFVLVPLLVLGIVSYQISSATLKNNISEQTIQTLKAIDRNLMNAVSQVNVFSDYVMVTGEIQNYLETNNTFSVIDLYNNQQSIGGLMYGNAQIDDFILYSKDGQQLHLRNSSVPEFESFVNSPFYGGIIEQKGRPVWLSPTDNQEWTSDERPVLTQGRVIKDIQTLEDLGYLVMNLNIRLFDDIFAQVSMIPSEEFLVDQTGKIIYSADHKRIGSDLGIDFPSFEVGEGGYILTDWEEHKSLVTYIPSQFKTMNADKLILVSVKPWDVLASEIFHIRNTTILLSVVAILIALSFNLLYLRRVSKFIQESLTSMKKIEQGSLYVQMKSFKLKELKDISTGFNNMVARMRGLIEDVKQEQIYKREAQFQVLQEQINPHFLYNTLESINALAAMNGQKEISKITINLGKLLRISINGDYEVMVQEEVRHVVSYLEIQKIRYDHAFQFQVFIAEDLKKAYVLKLILQPLVENSILHAFESGKTGIITIKGEIHEGKGVIEVRDNGKGIPVDILESLNGASKEKLGHGMMNVHKRLQLYYGKAYGLTVCSDSIHGTIIKMKFPLKGEKDEI
ncbi:cache domain-containing sensor histidine kinase [Pseudalkalibacillus hwajinpoensis]|uniref:cache domain-containing sensor histidine kinase n=1 Tax=Guptibacillus hwajinpoensis TaxID=208199 RepID=UPI001CD331AB|nr:sensor histidine kinase [Pseudalkalibacillus hwajinpoensis]MCA0990705.1 histidine kinase [Pseudalkalibacillus hwajinpoensis]